MLLRCKSLEPPMSHLGQKRRCGHARSMSGLLESGHGWVIYEYTPFCNGPGDVKSPRVIVTAPSSRFCPWSAPRPPHYAVRGTVSLSRYAWFVG
jgi:hypothetical protein